MRIPREQWAMQMAQITSLRSTCCRRSVGCVLLNARGHVLSTGYNGVAAGQKHCNESTGFRFIYDNGVDETKQLTGQATGQEYIYANACPGAHSPSGTNLDGCQAIHAEQNALLQCRDPWEIRSCFVTTSPCMTCVKLLLNTTCQEIYFVDEYPHIEAQQLWEASGRKWLHMP